MIEAAGESGGRSICVQFGPNRAICLSRKTLQLVSIDLARPASSLPWRLENVI